jgi:hypothetical protein
MAQVNGFCLLLVSAAVLHAESTSPAAWRRRLSGGVALGEGDCDWDSDCDSGNPLEFWKTSECGQPRNCDASFKQPDGCDLKNDPFSICDDCCYEKTSSWNLFCGVVVIGGIVGIALCVLCCGDCFDKSKKQATQNQTVLVNTAPVIAQNPVMMVPMQQPMQMPPVQMVMQPVQMQPVQMQQQVQVQAQPVMAQQAMVMQPEKGIYA